MNKTQQSVVYFLKNIIDGKKVSLDKNTHINWEALMDEIRAHNIEGLIYSCINNDSFNNIDNELLDNWKRNTFMSIAYQLKHINEVSSVLDLFNNNNIPVIVLKGLVIRDLYPRPELRTMCDADILVHKEDLDKVRELLLSIGYTETKSACIHLNFFKGSSHIEVHWVVTKEDYFEEIPTLEESIWKNAIEVNVGNSKALSMGNEDLAMHLCLHMAAHLMDRGFGIRQVVDLVLLVKEKNNEINWDLFLDKVRLCGIETFVKAIFAVSNELFDLEIPKQLESSIDKKIIKKLIDDIFSNGVHGRRDKAAIFAKELAYDMTDEGSNSFINRYIRFLFPSVDNMSAKYNYAKKHRILIPIAWIHHILAGAFNKDFSMREKIKFASSSVNISKNRNNLIKELDLYVN